MKTQNNRMVARPITLAVRSALFLMCTMPTLAFAQMVMTASRNGNRRAGAGFQNAAANPSVLNMSGQTKR